MIRVRPWFPASLARRFAFASAALVAAALVATSLVSWWLIDQQHQDAVRELASRETQYRAAAVGSDLNALALRMSEIASSTILATGLVDSAGRETYLSPFLAGIRQINGIPVHVLFTDFQGTEIARNTDIPFSPEQMGWLREHLEAGEPIAKIFPSSRGAEVVALEPLVYSRTTSPEGAVLYKVELRDIEVGPGMKLEWGPELPAAAGAPRLSAPVRSPPVFAPLHFRVRAESWVGSNVNRQDAPYLHVLLISLTLFSAVVLAGMQLARLLTLDLQRLQAFSSKLFGSGLSTERAPEGGSEEVSSLARSINDMLDRLNQQHSALLVEREKLTRLTQALQAADRNKDNFLAMLGHELRNPLAPISAGAELLRRIQDPDPRVARTSELIARQVGHMTKIVNDLLDVSRVTRGLITLDKSVIEMADVVSAGVEQVRPLLESLQHQLTVSMPPEAVAVRADRARLVQILSNLLTNAAKYTPAGGRIRVEVGATQDEVSLVVQDNGAGISAELMPEIFELFTQGARTVDRHLGGLGLGLALVKHLVAVHHGSVEASSPGPGLGATFTVRLPRVAASAATVPQALEPPPGGSQRLRVMVVDDNIDAAQTLAQLLRLEGHAVQVVHDGLSALALAEREQVDVFILDIGLPGMDGIELARRLRARPAHASALLIALTGYGQTADREKSAEARFDHHLVKPADSMVLASLLAGWSRERAHGRAARA